MPKWATPERQAHLLELWREFGNRCLKGHACCDNPEHYILHTPKPIPSFKVIEVTCQDRYGNVLRDKDGQPLKMNTYKPIPYYIDTLEVTRLYDLKESQAIENWVREDREAKAYLQKIISRLLHRIPEVGSLRGSFNAISRAIYADSQPQYYIENLGISGLTFKPFARIRIASSYTRLHVDISQPLAGLSKNRKRKFIRHGKPLPVPVGKEVELICNRAIARYLSR